MPGTRLGELAPQALFEANLIDEVGVNVNPILLGHGIPMFRRMSRSRDLVLIQWEQISGGCAYLLYRLRRL